MFAASLESLQKGVKESLHTKERSERSKSAALHKTIKSLLTLLDIVNFIVANLHDISQLYW
jgi:hypothetical protein